MEFTTTKAIDPGEIYDKVSRGNAVSLLLHCAVVREKTGARITHSVEFKRAGDVETELKLITDNMRTIRKTER